MDSHSTHVDHPPAADQGSWWCEPISSEFQFSPEVLEAMRAESVDGLMRLARGGIENGGILYGLRTAGSIRVLAARPLPCEHRFGPSFLLSDKDEPELQEMLDPAKQAEELRGLEPLGWYVSHCRRGPALADSDVRVSNQHFNKPGAVTVVLLPEKLGQAHARVFVRGSNGVLDPEVCARDMVMPGPIHKIQTQSMPEAKPDKPPTVPGAPPPKTEPAAVPEKGLSVIRQPLDLNYEPWRPTAAPGEHESAEGREVALNRLQSFLKHQENHRRVSLWNLAATIILILLLCGGIGGYVWIRIQNAARAGPPVVLRVAETGSGTQLRIDWDPTLTAVKTATGGELEIREGSGPAVFARLDADALRAGSAVYNHRSDNVEIRLHLSYANASPTESVVYFINPSVATAQKPAQQPLPQDTKPVTQPPRPIVPTRTFQPPRSATPQIATSESAPVLGTAPLPSGVELMPKQQAPNLPFPTTAAAPPPPPPPAPVASPAPAKTVEPVRPRHGRVIWTGDLARNALLTLSPAGASMGWANGKLPGFPITVSAHAAQLVEGGIQVYSGDEKNASHAEPPSAENGWNTVVFKYDPKNAPDIHIVVGPNASNSWNQLVIQNGKKPVSVIVIDWRAAESH